MTVMFGLIGQQDNQSNTIKNDCVISHVQNPNQDPNNKPTSVWGCIPQVGQKWDLQNHNCISSDFTGIKTGIFDLTFRNNQGYSASFI